MRTAQIFVVVSVIAVAIFVVFAVVVAESNATLLPPAM